MLPATLLVAAVSPQLGRRLLVAAGAGLVYLLALDLRSARATTDDLNSAVLLTAESLAARLMDDAAYSAGVWQGVFTHSNLEPVLPRIREMPSWRRPPS
jgi:hypothetical protein